MRPVTQEQWRDAVDAAELLSRVVTAQVLLFVEMGRLFGLVSESGEIDIQACYEIIEDGRNKGILPSAHTIYKFIDE